MTRYLVRDGHDVLALELREGNGRGCDGCHTVYTLQERACPRLLHGALACDAGERVWQVADE